MSATADPAAAARTPTVNPGDGPLFDDLAASVRAGKCILFIGAGAHHAPPQGSPFTYDDAVRPPVGWELAKELATACEFKKWCKDEPDDNLQRVSLCYQKVFGREKLVQTIKAAVDEGKRPSPALRGLAELPFTLVMTTNYDTLFERALYKTDEDKQPLVRVYTPKRYEPSPDVDESDISVRRPFLFKAHGDVDTPESIVVTDEDYINFVLRMSAEGEANHPIPETFRYRLNRWPTLFVGYRLLDFNLRLLFRTLRWNLDPSRRPSSYSVDIEPDPLVRDVWERDNGLRFIVEDVWEFVPRLYRAVLGRELEP